MNTPKLINLLSSATGAVDPARFGKASDPVHGLDFSRLLGEKRSEALAPAFTQRPVQQPASPNREPSSSASQPGTARQGPEARRESVAASNSQPSETSPPPASRQSASPSKASGADNTQAASRNNASQDGAPGDTAAPTAASSDAAGGAPSDTPSSSQPGAIAGAENAENAEHTLAAAEVALAVAAAPVVAPLTTHTAAAPTLVAQTGSVSDPSPVAPTAPVTATLAQPAQAEVVVDLQRPAVHATVGNTEAVDTAQTTLPARATAPVAANFADTAAGQATRAPVLPQAPAQQTSVQPVIPTAPVAGTLPADTQAAVSQAGTTAAPAMLQTAAPAAVQTPVPLRSHASLSAAMAESMQQSTAATSSAALKPEQTTTDTHAPATATAPATLTADPLISTAAARSLQDFTAMVAAARATSGTSLPQPLGLAPQAGSPTGMFAGALAGLLPGQTFSTQPFSGPAIAAPLGSPQWSTELGRQFISIAQAGGNLGQVAELRLDPPDLGPLRITINLNDNVAHAVFSSPHALVRQTVENALPQLQQMLEQAGISLGQANVNDQHQSEQASQQQAGSRGLQAQAGGNDQASDGLNDATATRQSRPADPSALVDTFA